MYLKSIEIHGFKSFANKITFNFNNYSSMVTSPTFNNTEKYYMGQLA